MVLLLSHFNRKGNMGMEFFNLFAAILAVGGVAVFFTGIALLTILCCVIADDNGHEFGRNFKWAVLLGSGLMLYLGVPLQGLNWVTIAWQFAAGAAIVCCAKFVESVSSARKSLKEINNSIKDAARSNLASAQRNLLERFEERADTKPFKQFILGDKSEPTRNDNVMRVVQAIIPDHGSILTRYKDCSATGGTYKVATIGATLARHIVANSEKYILENENGTVALNFMPLLNTDFFREIARQQTVMHFNKHDTLFTAQLEPTDKVIHDFAILESGRTFVDMTLTSLKAELNIPQFVHRLSSWTVFWPFYAVSLVFGRFLEMIAVMTKRVFGALFNKLVFKNII